MKLAQGGGMRYARHCQALPGESWPTALQILATLSQIE